MFDYIVCFYFGQRRTVLTKSLLKHDKYGFVKRHIDFLEKLTKKNILNDVIFVINDSNDIDYNVVSSLLAKSKIKKYDIIGRTNIDYSYGAWNDALIKNINSKAKYALLLEDDYIPTSLNFYKHFFKKFDNNTAYVCQYYANHGQLGMHAAISNGFIDYEKCRTVYQQKQKIFELIDQETSNNYKGGTAEKNQINFLKILTNEFQYSAKDITEENYSVFLDSNSVIKVYGNINGNVLIGPILELPTEYYDNILDTNLTFRKIIDDDLEFLNTVRNAYAEEYLHDSRTFTLDQTIEWFKNFKPNFYIIELDCQKIGYFRLSNHSIEDKSIYIGADISPKYKGLGYGKACYKKFIPYLFKEYDLNKISLEVLATNTVAISLYEKLGFKVDYVKKDDVKKGDTMVDSIMMSIIKDGYE